MEQFESRVKAKFGDPEEEFERKFAVEGSDSGARIRDGVITLSG